MRLRRLALAAPALALLAACQPPAPTTVSIGPGGTTDVTTGTPSTVTVVPDPTTPVAVIPTTPVTVEPL